MILILIVTPPTTAYVKSSANYKGLYGWQDLRQAYVLLLWNSLMLELPSTQISL